ncbi:MAG TPA: DciA family protein [Pseudolysinimonas sp.]|nr:DciA family protein [Pseudolysinimonas sp.]
MTDEIPEHVAVYQRIRAAFGDPALRSGDARRRQKNSRDETSVPYGKGREPRGIDDVLQKLTSNMGWNSPLARAELLGSWSAIVGDETAGHTEPVGVDHGVLTVRCDSTAWAQQLRLMRTQITTRIAERFGDAGIESIKFLGPDAPSWKRGPRAIPGRGPRDTYG